MAAVGLVDEDAPDSGFVPLLAARVASEADGANQFGAGEGAQDIVIHVCGGQTFSENFYGDAAMLLGGFAKRARFLIESFEPQMPECFGILRSEDANLYIHGLGPFEEPKLVVSMPGKCSTLFSLAIGLVAYQAHLVAQSASTAEQKKILADATDYAFNHERNLPNFLCTQTTRRFQDFRAGAVEGHEDWRPVDIIVERLAYFDHREDYKVIEINGVASSIDHEQLGGASSSGEFGSVMKGIFAPQTATEFTWQTWFTLRGRKMDVYAYRVAASKSEYHVLVRELSEDFVAGYHGLIFIDDRTHFVHRITLHADGIPPAYPIQDVSLMLDYEYTRVGDADYLLPLTFELRSREGNVRIKNDVDYQDYRKFTADSSVRFGEQDTPGKK